MTMIVYPALLFSRPQIPLHIEWELHYKVFERVSSQSLDPHLPVVPETRSSSVLFPATVPAAP
ncbi:hypothetical protein FCV90_24545 [Escherichia coli]|nr:hypothetical protein [Escherichia coli]